MGELIMTPIELADYINKSQGEVDLIIDLSRREADDEEEQS